MTIQTFSWGLICVLGISAGQILFKLSSKEITFEGLPQLINGIIYNYYLLIGLLIYVVTTFLWISLLKIVDLKDAYPIMALAFIIVPLLAKFFLKEEIEFKTIFGGLIIIIGIIISVR